MNHLRCLLILLLVFGSSAASAEFYRYLDDDGTVTYTDDMNSVPPEQRAIAREYFEYSSPPLEPRSPSTNPSDDIAATGDSADNLTESESVAPPEEPLAESGTQPDETPAAAQGQDASLQTDALMKRSEVLNQEFSALESEREEINRVHEEGLDEEGETFSNLQVVDLNNRIRAYNKKVKAFEKKRKEHNAEVRAYNANLEKNNSKDNAAEMDSQ